jgi:hypothetical protein
MIHHIFAKISIFLILIVFGKTTSVEHCNSDDLESPSYKEMFEYIKLDGILKEYVVNSSSIETNIFQAHCREVLDKGKIVQENYMKNVKCFADHEMESKGFLLIEKVLDILKYWCSFEDKQRKGKGLQHYQKI